MTAERNYIRCLHAPRRRLIWVAFLRHACIAGPLGAVAAAFGLAWGTGALAGVALAGVALAGVAGLLAAALVAALRAPTLRQTAAAIDMRLGLPDRMVAALEFAGSPAPIDRLIVESAARRLDDVVPATLFPVRAGTRAAVGAVSTALALVLAAWNGAPPETRGRTGSGLSMGSPGAATGAAPGAASGAALDASPERSASDEPGRQAGTAVPGAPRADAESAAGERTASAPAAEPAAADQAIEDTPAEADRNARAGDRTATRDGAGGLARGREQASGATADAGGRGRAAGAPADAPSDTAAGRSSPSGAAGSAAETAGRGNGAGGIGGGRLQGDGARVTAGARASAALVPPPIRTPGDVEAALRRHDVPPHLRPYVRRYFSAIGQTDQE